MLPRKFETISCPNCKYQYLPAEIYIPKYFFGKPYGIERNIAGQIVEFEGSSINQNEQYTCDQCGVEFKVSVKLTFQTSLPENKEDDEFEHEYVTPIKSTQLFNEEG